MFWRTGLPAIVAVLVAFALVAGSRGLGEPPPQAVVAQPAPPPSSTPPSLDPGVVTAAVNEVAPGTDLAFALYDEQTGQSLASVNGDQQFYTASLVKLFIALDALQRNEWHPSERLGANLTEMLSASDDGIAEALWEYGGRSAIITRMVQLIGLAHTRPPTFSDQWEMTKTTADDLVAVYRFLVERVPDEARGLVLGAMAGAQNPAADGFPQYFGIPDGLPDLPRAVKQGWMTIQRAVVLNTTGLVDSRYVVVLLAELPLETSYARGRAALTAGIAALAPVLGH
ncbi:MULTISPECIES: serine hydrolase [Amycolatopsis]|uniref:Beta-lactamase class A n=2 Tax=Amycolatopsis TaxID=1813 RepID=A0A1I3YZX0_9PSEU|nr:serine hydrolase [Amycolatopsis sacchari]SFK37424.1 hypothetical protein SAMN05421835_11989 [Amycolatopsis sacchari]